MISVSGTVSEENMGARPRGRKLELRERGGPPLVVTGAGCEPVGSRVRCASARIKRLRVGLGPGADFYHATIGRLAKDIRELVRGGAGDDSLSLRDNSPPRRMRSRGATVKGGSGNDRIRGGPGDDRLLGGVGDDYIQSARADELRGDDFLSGGDGDDRLIGARGDDVLRGGPGNDLCVPRGGNDRLYSCERVR